MPTTANGYDYDYDVVHARGENAEIEVHGAVGEHPGIVRLLGYMNHARMGNYDEAIAGFRSGADSAIDVTKSRRAGRIKYGAGLNIEQEIAANAFVFARLGWNEGQNESFANTEVDNTVLVGIDLRGELWQRPGDRMGLAVVTNGISASHREYLHLGGEGFLLGDGGLQYGRESIFEAFYTARAVRGVFPAIDIQVVENPGYNIDRGPVVIGSLRLHIEL